VVAASVAVLVVYWDELGGWGVLALALAYLAGYLAASESLRPRQLAEPADVLEAVAVAWVGVATYAVQEVAGVWPAGADGDEIHAGITAIAFAAIAAAVALQAVRPDPLLVVPLGAATTVLAFDLAELVFDATIDTLGERERVAFVLPLGLAWIAAGLRLDVARRRDYAEWAHWCGLLMAGAAVVALIPKTVPGFTLLGILGAIALFFSAFVRHWSFTVLGALGVLMATVAALGELGRVAPAVMAVVGVALILVGLRWSRWRESIRTAVLARMPRGARELVERLAP
jgi:hypothetical protein